MLTRPLERKNSASGPFDPGACHRQDIPPSQHLSATQSPSAGASAAGGLLFRRVGVTPKGSVHPRPMPTQAPNRNEPAPARMPAANGDAQGVWSSPVPQGLVVLAMGELWCRWECCHSSMGVGVRGAVPKIPPSTLKTAVVSTATSQAVNHSLGQEDPKCDLAEPCRGLTRGQRSPRVPLGSALEQGQSFKLEKLPHRDGTAGEQTGGDIGAGGLQSSNGQRAGQAPHLWGGSWQGCLEPMKASRPRGWLQGLLKTGCSEPGKDKTKSGFPL